MYPMMAPEMISARVEELRREGEARGREPRGAPPRRRMSSVLNNPMIVSASALS
jgi:hypothetical protein